MYLRKYGDETIIVISKCISIVFLIYCVMLYMH